MSPIEHYFENLLDMGSDIKGEPNKNALSKEVQEAIEICADYIKSINQLGVASELEKNSKKLEKDFGELDCISRADAIRVASGYCHPSNVAKELAKLPSVTPQEPRKGHWIYKEFDERTGITNVHICSKCGCPLASPYKSFCSNCGSDNREVEE